MKKQKVFDLASMPKMVLIVALVVMLGTLFGATSYLLKAPKTDLPIINPVIEAQCETDSDCELVYVGSDIYPPCDTLSEKYQCLNKNEAKEARDEWDDKFNTDLYTVCSPCAVEFDRYVCKCANGKCEKVKEELVEEVIITTDKMEYEQGENVSVIIKNNFSEEIFISYPIVERIINDNHIPLKGSVVWSGCGVPGGLTYLFLKPSEAVKHQWDQKEKWCSTDFSDRNVYSKEVLPGKYRVKSEIIKRVKSEEEDPTNVSGKPSGEFIYSNEFTIKEKSALDPRCGEKVKIFGDCPAYFEEGGYYEFNSEAGKCIEKFVSGSGCGVTNPFYSLKECQEVCEEKTELDFYSCNQNSDCISVKKDCCGCTAGGSAIAINKKLEDEWNEKLDCEEIGCPAVMSDDPSCFQEPKCAGKSGRCFLAKSGAMVD